MSDLLYEMSSDAGSTADKIDRLEDDQLDSIAKLANDAANLGQKIAATEELLRAQKRSLREITDERLPEALETMGLHFPDRKSTRLNSSHRSLSRMPSSA